MAVPIDMPNNPTIGELYTATNGIQYIWDGVKWTSVNGAGGGGNAKVDVDDTPPTNPTEGNLWFNSSNGILYIWYVDADQSAPLGEGQWVDTRPGGEASGGSGGLATLASVCANGNSTTTTIQSGGNPNAAAATGAALLPTGQLQVSSATTANNVIQLYTTGTTLPSFAVTGGGAASGDSFAAVSAISGGTFVNTSTTFAVNSSGGLTASAITSNGAVNVTGSIVASSTCTASKFVGNVDIDALSFLP